MIIDRVNKWLKRFEKYLFTYKDGFFELPYLHNTPELMIASLSKMPMNKHQVNEKAIYTDNPFVKGVLRYREIEKGLWLMVSDMSFKMNIRTKAIVDNEIADYYFLAFSTYQNKIRFSDMKINDILLPSKSWAIYKPGAAIDALHFKGTQGLYYNFALSKVWIQENLLPNIPTKTDDIFEIINSESGIVCWDDIVFEAAILANKMWLNMGNTANFNHLQLKIYTLELVAAFFKNIQKRHLKAKSNLYSSTDQITMTLVEKGLVDNLTKGFPGIEQIAKTANMSSSKLKSTFKMAYGQPIFQYYRNKQMDLAMQLIKTSDVQIKNISFLLGYENPSKFTAYFKKYHRILPSEVSKTSS